MMDDETMLKVNNPDGTFDTESPLVYMLTLPDGCTPGRWEAAEQFAENFKKVQRLHPGKRFQFVPFAYIGGALSTVMAVEVLG